MAAVSKNSLQQKNNYPESKGSLEGQDTECKSTQIRKAAILGSNNLRHRVALHCITRMLYKQSYSCYY
jgi:hypothetical protein